MDQIVRALTYDPPDNAAGAGRTTFFELHNGAPFYVYNTALLAGAEYDETIPTCAVRILYSHGMSEDLEAVVPIIRGVVQRLPRMSACGTYQLVYHLLVYDYAGYGQARSVGPVSGDLQATRWAEDPARELFTRTKAQPLDVTVCVCWGYSLGAAYACLVAGASDEFRGVVDLCFLEAPFQSVLKSQASHMVNALVYMATVSERDDRFRSHEYIQTMECRKVALHGQLDKLVPVKRNGPVFNKHAHEHHVIAEADHDWFRTEAGMEYSSQVLMDNIDVIYNQKLAGSPGQKDDNNHDAEPA